MVSSAPTSAAAVSPSTGSRAYDVFNGDADGICALHQLRLAYPRDAVLVSGVKRDIELLRWIPCAERIDVTVLDISLDANAAALRQILDGGGRVTYFDHHSAQKAFTHPRLQLIWDDAPEVCTSILVNRHLQGRFRPWAIAAAFGDNLPAIARALGASAGMDSRRVRALELLGRILNYNAYGEQVEDLHMAPDRLYKALHRFVDPFEFIDAAPEYQRLVDGYRSDTAHMDGLLPTSASPASAIYILPCTPWARRISGVFANQLVEQGPARSYAVLTEKSDGSYVVSVRSGQPAIRSANGLCEQFATGGGRKAAAGINTLPASDLADFERAFFDYFAARVVAPSGAFHAG